MFVNKGLLNIVAGLTLLTAGAAESAAPVCYSSHGGYCAYEGKVRMIYANSGGLILMYFDAPVSVQSAQTAGYTITNVDAGVVQISDNPEFAKLFYSTALAAQSSKRNVMVQLRGVASGYLKIDRIWLSEGQ